MTSILALDNVARLARNDSVVEWPESPVMSNDEVEATPRARPAPIAVGTSVLGADTKKLSARPPPHSRGVITTEWESVIGGPPEKREQRLRGNAAEFRPMPLSPSFSGTTRSSHKSFRGGRRQRQYRPYAHPTTPIVIREMVRSRADSFGPITEKIDEMKGLSVLDEPQQPEKPKIAPPYRRARSDAPSPPSPLIKGRIMRELTRSPILLPHTGTPPFKSQTPKSRRDSPPELSLATPAAPPTAGVTTGLLWRSRTAATPKAAPRPKLQQRNVHRSRTTPEVVEPTTPKSRKVARQQAQHYARVLSKKQSMVGKFYGGKLDLTPKGNGWVLTKDGLPNIRVSKRIIDELELKGGLQLVCRVDGCSDGQRGTSRVNCYSSTVRMANHSEMINSVVEKPSEEN